MTETPRRWRPIATAPADGRPILVGFEGQFGWVYFVAQAWGSRTEQSGYADPTHWTEIPEIDVEESQYG